MFIKDIKNSHLTYKMSTEVSSNNVQDSTLIVTNVIGSVKWFNNRYGYGFLVATGEHSSYGDVFVHHSELKISDPNIYKFLTQGEYVQFNIVKTTGGKHEFQAGSVTGVNGGRLLCENSPSTYSRAPRHHSDDSERRTSHQGERVERTERSETATNTTQPRAYRPRDNTRSTGPRTTDGPARTQRRSQDEDGFTIPRSRTPRETPYKNAVSTGGSRQKNV